jgi:7,8-dihydroneopterin aldolase/epimerase/oxygenase
VSYTVEVRGLRVVAVVGALAEERERPQPLQIDLDIELDDAVARTDEVVDTADYAVLCELAVSTITESEPKLLETACALVAEALLDADQHVQAVTVTIAKLRPPIPLDVDTVGVRLCVKH